jgi:hypothetical protein
MVVAESFEEALTRSERQFMARLSTPAKIQAFLDELAYSSDEIYRCPLRVLRERIGNCFDGALFGAAALRQLGHQPRIIDMLPNGRDDDHLLAVYTVDEHWGAVAKSNFVGLRYREPIYRTLRELVMSYFEQYFNVAGEKTLIGYTRPLNLKAFDRRNWMVRDEPLDSIAQRLDEIQRVSILTGDMAARLSLLDTRSYQAGLLGVNEAGLYRLPGKGEA